jgi:hypothetical protein
MSDVISDVKSNIMSDDMSPTTFLLFREEQDLLEILDLELIGLKILVLIFIDCSQPTVALLDSCLV